MPKNNPKSLWEDCWKLLLRGQSDGKHAYATPVVATVSADGHPHSRTLVLRKAIKASGELWCYTDRRSRKAQHLAQGSPLMSWTFWAPRHKIQCNASGPTDWLPEEVASERFRSLPKHSRKSYATLAAPGVAQLAPTDGLPDDWGQRDLPTTNYAADHFGILCTRLTRVEILQLDRDGHRRLLAEREVDGEWAFTWLVP